MKKNIDVARAWRDEDYYLSLTEEERASLGAHPAGAAMVADEALRSISGGCGAGNKTPAVTACKLGDEVWYCN
jgi:mersacidin/lichenicidin family type 2 lantibiotic